MQGTQLLSKSVSLRRRKSLSHLFDPVDTTLEWWLSTMLQNSCDSPTQ